MQSKKILLIFIIILSITCTKKNQNNYEYKIQLESDFIDNYDLDTDGSVLGPSNTKSPYYEDIKKYPDDYNVKYTYNICLQPLQKTYKRLCDNVEEREKYFSRFTDEKFEDWQLKYTKDSLDCITSFCLVEDSSGNEYMIFDENNDEDISNEKIKEFQTKTMYSELRDTTYNKIYIDSDVEFEYYNGKEMKKGNYGIRISKFENWRPGQLVQSSVYGNFGTFEIEGKKYLIGITKKPDIEFSKYDRLWIDLNQNKKYDYIEDFFEQMYLPLTLEEKAYKIAEIDRFGKSLTIKACNQDSVPPIAISLSAPDFCEITFDSTEVRLSDYKGKYIILDFWTCSGSSGLPFTNEIYKVFEKNEKFKVVSIGPYEPKYLPPKVREIKISWPHVNGLFEVKTRTLFQVGGMHTTFLINPEGIIIARKVFALKEDIIKLIKEHND